MDIRDTLNSDTPLIWAARSNQSVAVRYVPPSECRTHSFWR